MTMILHQASEQDLRDAGRDLAQSDRDELERVEPGRNPVTVLLRGHTQNTMAISQDGRVLAVGAAEGGYIWFVHTHHAEALGRVDRLHMLRLLRSYLKVVRRKSPGPLRNVVSVENHKHVKLLRFLNARFGTTTYTINGHTFYRFAFD